MQFRIWMVRASVAVAALVASLCAGWKWEHLP
jgi:hypothetical protein